MDAESVEWDEGNWPKCAKHGVTKAEIEALLLWGDPMIMADRTQGLAEARYNAVGRTEQGRALFIVYTVRMRLGVPYFRPISARYMHAREMANYDRQKGA
jgi:uncharacterized DUF497 family protein